jgi:FAD/FMN-containing dehydrogenase/Fe-S oxidoreductase
VDAAALEADLRAAVDGEIRWDAGSRAAYSTDASNYRQIPTGVVIPRSVEAAVDAIAVCRRHHAPVTSRGGGTGLAGQCVNTGVVIDWSKYCHRLIEVDAESRTCVVEPGIVLDRLNTQLRAAGLEYGPAPATHSHCTLGGMIGNNSCGATAQRSGKVEENIVALEILCYDGTRLWVGQTSDDEYESIVRRGGRPAEIYRALWSLRDQYADQIRRRFPDIPRRVSGYNLNELLPERGFHVARALVGTEGTCVTVLRARLALLPIIPARSTVFVAFDDIADAADAVPAVLPHRPVALEGIDQRLLANERARHLNTGALADLPAGDAFLLVQFGGQTRGEAVDAARRMLADLGQDTRAHIFDDPDRERLMWQIRESGLGATARVPGHADTWPGWEDSAVDPLRLGGYLRELRSLMDRYGLGDASLYGHFGQGCVHTSIPFELTTAGGIAGFRSFVEQAADLVVRYGGSLSGEHGDGQARAELLPRMFGPELVAAFRRFKAIFDPDGRMNPGKVVDPNPLDGQLRLGPDLHHGDVPTVFGYPQDSGSFSHAAMRCVGVGKCRHDSGGVMCPSYMVTREEEHSTRGRARLLFEMLDGGARGGTITDGWRSTAVRDALDLCLACKGCKSDCPVNVDMATYKAEFLSHHYRGRLRPRSHYSMGWLPVAAAAVSATSPRLVNLLTHTPAVAALARRVAGIDHRREVPRFAPHSFQGWFARRRGPRRLAGRGDVVLWPDTFTNRFDPEIARAAVAVLEDAGWRVHVPPMSVCCGLTWISTGQLDTARRVLRRSVSVLRPYLRAGTLVVGLEPSCTAVLRSDAADLFPHDEDVARLRRQTVTLAELLHEHTPGWRPRPVRRPAIVQTHCHQHAVLGFDADRAVLDAAGVQADVLDSGCCGLAGNFGFEAGHYDVSMACAERVLMPAVRAAGEATAVVADGFSCRTQIAQGDANGRRAVHLAQLLAEGLRSGHATEQRGSRPRPAVARAMARAATGMAAAGLVGVAAWAIGRHR